MEYPLSLFMREGDIPLTNRRKTTMPNPTYWLAAILNEVEAYEVSSADLGSSPAELSCNPEGYREVSLIDHQGSPEMDLTNVVEA